MAKVELYSSKLRDLGYSKSQIASVIEKLRSVAPTLYPYLLRAVLYSTLIKLYQQIDVSELKKGLESIIREFESSESSILLYDILDDILGGLDFIINKILDWEFYHLTTTPGDYKYEYLFGELKLKELRGYQYHILPPSRALKVFLKYSLKYLSKKFSNIEEPSKKDIIKSIKDYLRNEIKKLERYEKENLPKLLNESFKGIIEIYEKLRPIIEGYLTYIEDIETLVKKYLDGLKSGNKEICSPHDCHFELHRIYKKLHSATEMRYYIENILNRLYLIVINKVSIDEIMKLLNRNKDLLSNLEKTYNLLSSEQWKLISCEIMKRDWCNER